ncbi:hypothetical protein GCM10010348_78880 [Streptomyces anthocyanicus]|nr:hypothetical protein GCM10010348_78880 [Streptomyces anthocyanicus]
MDLERLDGLVPLKVVRDLVDGVDQRDAHGFWGVGHEARVGVISTRFKRSLDATSEAPYCRAQRIQAPLGALAVVHSYRTQSADDTQTKTGRTLRLLPRRPALTTRF